MDVSSLLPSQVQAIQAVTSGKYPFVHWAGSVRSGKTYGNSLAMVGLSRRCRPDSQFILAGRSLGSLQRNVVPYFVQAAKQFGLPMSTKLAGSNPHIQLDRRIFYLFGCNSAKSEYAIAGATACGAMIDEVSLIPESAYNQIVMRCSDEPGVVVGGTNKSSPFGWFKQEVWDKMDDLDGIQIENTLEENRYLTEKTIKRYKKTFSGHYHKRFIENEWAAPGGAVYQGWQYDDREVPKDSEVYISCDWGASGVTHAIYWAKRDYGFQFVDEYRHEGRATGRMTEDRLASEICNNGYKVTRGVSDPSAPNFIDALKRQGVNCGFADNRMDLGIVTLTSAFDNGKVRISRKCKHLLAELDNYLWNATEDKPVKGNDHGCDAARYGGMAYVPFRTAGVGRLIGF